MRKVMIGLLELLLWGTMQTASSATFYVSTAGNDANDGRTPSSPWKTVAKVNSSTFNPGDSILFKRGDVWIGRALLPKGVIVPTNGTADNPITFGAYGTGSQPVFDWQLDGYGRGFQVQGRHWIVIEGIEIRKFSWGIYIADFSSNITIRDCEIHQTGSGSLRLQNNVQNILIERNRLHHTGLTSVGEGIYVGTNQNQWEGNPDRTSKVTIRNNTIYNTPGEAVELKAGTRHCLVENNIIHTTPMGIAAAPDAHDPQPAQDNLHVIKGNRIYNLTGKSNGGNPPYGIAVNLRTDVFQNIIYAGEGVGIYILDDKGDGRLRKIYNNTIHNQKVQGIRINTGANVDLQNNLLWANGGSGMLSHDPIFLDPPNGDFRLRSGSPAIDVGVDVGLPFNGATPDLGALEFVPEYVAPSMPKNLRVIVNPE